MADIFDAAVLVTGVTGYLGSHVAKILLEDGRKVRGTVRSTKDEEKMTILRNTLCSNPKHPLELVEADLTKDEGWEKAVEGCIGICHVASPFPNITNTDVKEEDVVVPAREGTLRLLRAASKTPSVKRVVLTSSFASVCGKTGFEETHDFNEEDWTDPEDESIDFYTKSKTVAEKAAWDFVKELQGDEKFELAVINPTLILGPPLLKAHKAATSVQIIGDVLNRTYPMNPKVSMPVCDVRDVAKAHIEALTNSDAANHRHIITSDTCWMKDWGICLAKEFKPQGYGISTLQAPYIAIWLMGCFNKQVKNTVLPRIGKKVKINNSRMTDVLKVTPTPMDDSLKEMAYAMIELGIVEKTKKYKSPDSDGTPSSPDSTKSETEPSKNDVVIEELEPENNKPSNEEKKDEKE